MFRHTVSPQTLSVTPSASFRGPRARTPRAVLAAVVVLALCMLAPAVMAQVLDISPDARVDLTGDGEPELPPFAVGEGACGLFVKFVEGGAVTSINVAEEVLSDPSDARRWDPDLAFRAIVPVISLWDGAAGQGFRMQARQLMPWSVVNEDRFGGGACIDGPEEAITGNHLGIRLQALFKVEEAGIHTFVAQGDDGFRLRIGGDLVVERPGLGVALAFSRRVRFEEPGLYPLQVDYFEAMGEAYLAVHHAPEELLFRQVQAGGGEYSLVSDAEGSDADGWPLNVPYEDVIPLLSASSLLLPRHLDDDAASCVDQLDDPAAICTPDDDVSPELRCGNGNPADLADGLDDPCDDGNNLDGDGCSAECETEPGWVCRGTPSTCLEDRDGDGIPDIEDNCPDLPNPDQADTRGNGIGDACDLHLLLPMDGDHLDNPTPTIEGTVQPDTPVTLTLGELDPVTVTASAAGTFSWTPTDALTHGPWTLTANATVNGIDTSDTLSFTLWLDPPTVAILTPADGETLPSDQPLAVTGSAPAGLTVSIGLDDATLATADADTDGQWSASLPLTGDLEGSVTLFATVTDPMGTSARDERSLTLLAPAGPGDGSDTPHDSSDDGDDTGPGDDSDGTADADGTTDADGSADAGGDAPADTGAPGDGDTSADADGDSPGDAADEASDGDESPGSGESGCGCAAGSGSGGPAALLLLLGLLAVRRRAD